MSSKPRVAIVTNIAWNIYNFRLALATAIKEAGFEPLLIAASDDYSAKLIEEGWTFVAVKHLQRTGINPVKDMLLLDEFVNVYKKYDVKFALHYNAKPLIYASLAAAILKIPFIPSITGLAGPFTGNRKIIASIVTKLYKTALRKSKKVVFQNKEDQEFFISNKIVPDSKAILVEGSGVNMDNFRTELFQAAPTNKIIFLMFARLSRAKGVEYYIEASKIIKKEHPNVEFKLAGPYDSDEFAISKEEIEGWHNTGIIEYLGVSDFIQNEISQAHVIVYPSYYREGVPKSLIESAAMSKPIITTDNVGCREVVQNGVNGYLIPIKDSVALANACRKFIMLSDEEKLILGAASRKIATTRFDEKLVIAAYIKLINQYLIR